MRWILGATDRFVVWGYWWDRSEDETSREMEEITRRNSIPYKFHWSSANPASSIQGKPSVADALHIKMAERIDMSHEKIQSLRGKSGERGWVKDFWFLRDEYMNPQLCIDGRKLRGFFMARKRRLDGWTSSSYKCTML